MKRILFLSILILNFGAVNAAHAEKADTDKDTNVEADQNACNNIKQICTYFGNVIVTRGTLVMKAEKVVLTQDPSGFKFAMLYAAPGGLATFRQKRDGGANLWVEGQAERIEYDGKSELVKLISNAKMRQMNGDKPANETQAELLTYDNREENFAANNTASGDKPSAGRVKMVIHHRDEPKGGQ